MIELFTAIYSQFTGPVDGSGKPITPNALYTALPGGLHNTKIPQYPTYPHAVFQLVSGTADHLFMETLEDVLLQFNIFDTSQSATNVCNIFNDLNALYDNCILSVSNYGFISMLREFQHLIRNEEQEGGFWQYLVQYRIIIEKG